MSNTQDISPRDIARQARALIKGTGAKLAGRERVTEAERPIHRDSYDVDDGRANVWRPIADGTTRGAMRWRDKMLIVAREFDAQTRMENRKAGKRTYGDLTPHGLTVFEAVLRFPHFCFKSGRLDPALSQLGEITGFPRQTIVSALARLKKHGFLQWVRRTCKTGADGIFAPQRKQTNNAYFFDAGTFRSRNKRAWLRLRELLGRPAAAAPAATQATVRAISEPSPSLAALLSAFDADLARASHT